MSVSDGQRKPLPSDVYYIYHTHAMNFSSVKPTPKPTTVVFAHVSITHADFLRRVVTVSQRFAAWKSATMGQPSSQEVRA